MENRSYKISYAQRRLWLIDQFDNSGNAYNITNRHFFKHLDAKTVERTIEYLINRHEVLRTTFKEIEGEPRQVIRENAEMHGVFTYVDFSNLGNPQSEVRQYLGEVNYEVLDLQHGPLMKTYLLKLDNGNYCFAFVVHHIVFDGWSMEVFINELQQVYEAFAAGQPVQLPPLKFQYKDYAEKENNLIANGGLDAAKSFWQNLLEPTIEPLVLYPNQKRSVSRNFNGGAASMTFGSRQSAALKRFCAKNQSSVLIAFISVLKSVFYRYSGNTDQVIGTVVSGRESLELENQIGFYVNTLPLRTSFDGKNDSFKQVFEKVRERMLDLFLHQNYPFDLMVDELGVDRTPGRNPIFDILVTNNQKSEHSSDSVQREGEIVFEGSHVAKFELTFHFSTNTDTIGVKAIYDQTLYPAPFIEQLLRHFNLFLEAFIVDPDQKISTVNMVDDLVRDQFSNLMHKVPFPQDKDLASYWDEVVVQYGNYTAMVSGNDSFTYEEMDAFVWKAAKVLRDKYGLKQGQVIGIHMTRSVEFVTLILAATKLGVVYVPIDKSVPLERIQYMLEKACCRLLITSDPNILEIDEVEVIQTNQLLQHVQSITGDKVRFDAVSPDQSVYIIFTSGSSGKPKGVEVGQKSLINLTLWYQDLIGIKAGDQTALFVSISFDVNSMEVWPSILAGATVHILNEDTRMNPKMLSEYSHQHSFNHLFVPTAFYHSFSQQQFLPETCTVITGGEKLKSKGDGTWKLINMYGPTEATVISSWYEVRNHEVDYPIGRPITNSELLVLDEQMQMVPKWILGELYIGGAGLAIGYINDDELTNDAFMESPFSQGERLYKTGDLCYWDDDYQLHFVRRINDKQIKLRGFRIELEDIERNMDALEGVDQAIVTLAESPGFESQVVGFYVGSSSESNVASGLLSLLPDYMVPSSIISMDQFPLNSNGKVDRKKLTQEFINGDLSEVALRQVVVPVTDTEVRLLMLWNEIFGGTYEISTEDSFFELGGHSLLAMKLVNRIHENLDVSINLRDIFAYPTIVKLAGYLDLLNKDERAAGNMLVPLSNQSELPNNLFCIPPVIGSALAFLPLSMYLKDQFNVFGFDYPGINGNRQQADSVEEIAEIYAELLLERFPDQQEFRILGFSLGVWIGFELIKKLEAHNKQAIFVMLDRPSVIPMAYRNIHVTDDLIKEVFQSEFGFIRQNVEDQAYEHIRQSFLKYFKMGVSGDGVSGKVEADMFAIQAEASESMKGWEVHTTGTFSLRTLEGHHYNVLKGENFIEIRDTLLSTLKVVSD